MKSGRERLLNAATTLLSQHPEREPSTRELYQAAGVAAPTLYHHFGTKEGLLDIVVEQAFADYLERKHGMLRTGDLLADFAAGWDLHIEFGVANPMLYALMYGPHLSRAAATADAELRRGLQRLAAEGLLRVSVEDAAATTTATAIGCVTMLNRLHAAPTASWAQHIRAGLIEQITGQPRDEISQEQAARALLARMPSPGTSFTPAEASLLRQWLAVLATAPDAEQVAPVSSPSRKGSIR
ncbi:TetR/AcrR family transcriptional regulator [Paramicrobacterium fandaimingii]|uniref:TetR/AcrR family transcriptional regulator n=1 Tax=Paramicrobacterium fandaimingii TaxID=2708079 RepID=UPI00141DA5F0|nr:TetR/AcrR family transcriptional regulator [Microbacterium fandaimingii]